MPRQSSLFPSYVPFRVKSVRLFFKPTERGRSLKNFTCETEEQKIMISTVYWIGLYYSEEMKFTSCRSAREEGASVQCMPAFSLSFTRLGQVTKLNRMVSNVTLLFSKAVDDWDPLEGTHQAQIGAEHFSVFCSYHFQSKNTMTLLSIPKINERKFIDATRPSRLF